MTRKMKAQEVNNKANPKRARSLFVLAAVEVEKYREKTLTVVSTGTMATMATMAGQKTVAGRATMAKGTMMGGGKP